MSGTESAEPVLARVRVVLVAPQHPGNIGAAARALKTMGLRDFWLVAPQAFPHAEAEAMAANAGDVLAAAHVVQTLPQALADCTQVVASSARPRYLSVPVSAPREWAARYVALAADSPDTRVALLFGRERTGLSNEELDLAQELVVIPTGPENRSLNLGAAVQVLAYELRVAAEAAGAEPPAPDRVREAQYPPATQDELERFYTHLEATLVRTRFLDPDNPRLLMRRLRHIYGRAAVDRNELNILRGFLTSIHEALDRRGAHAPRGPDAAP